MSKTVKIILAAIVSLILGSAGGLVTTPSIPTWYVFLNKPFFSPPNWLFGPVWTILYILIGISFALIWSKYKKGDKKVIAAMKLFGIQFLLNIIWSPVFFGLKNLFLAFIIIIFMWYFLFKTIKAFAKIDKKASYLLYPYLAWISFASLLNFSVWILNR